MSCCFLFLASHVPYMMLFYGDMTQDDVIKLQKVYIAAINYMFDVPAEDIKVDLKAYRCYTQEG